MDSNTLENVLAIGMPVIIAIIGYLAKLAELFFKKKKEEIDKNMELKEKQDKDDRFLKYMGIAAENAHNIVVMLNADIVEGLKKASEDGKLTEDEIVQITQSAVLLLSNSLSDDAKDLLAEFVGDLNDYFTMLVKAKVEEVKNTKLLK